MFKYFSALLLCCNFFTANSQPGTPEISELKKKITCAGIKLLSNGHTFVAAMDKNKLWFSVYDEQHKLIVENKLGGDQLHFGVEPDGIIYGPYEMGNEVVFFLRQDLRKHIALTRLRIDMKDYNVIEESPLVEEDLFYNAASVRINGKVASFKGKSICYPVMGETPDCYAIAIGNYDHTSSENMRLLYFVVENGEHKMVSEIPFSEPSELYNEYKRSRILVTRSRIYLTTVAYKTERGNKASSAHLIISQVSPGSNDLTHSIKDAVNVYGYTITSLSLINGRVMFGYSNSLGDNPEKLDASLYAIDTNTLSLSLVTNLYPGKLHHDYLDKMFSVQSGRYYWMPVEIIPFGDGFAALFEYNTTINLYTAGHLFSKTAHTDLAVTVYDAWGKEQYSQLVPHWVGNSLSTLPLDKYAFFSTDTNLYLVLLENADIFKPGRKGMETDYNKTSTICYQVSAGNVVRTFPFGEPLKKHDWRHINLAAFDPKSKTVISYAIFRQGKETYKMAWTKFE